MKKKKQVTQSLRVKKGEKRNKNFFNTCAENKAQISLCKKCLMIYSCQIRKMALAKKSH